MAHFHAVQALVLKDAQLGLGAMIAQMRRDGQPSHVVHERGDFGELRQRLLHVRSPATAQIPPERVADGVAGTAIDERPRDMRPPQGAAISAEELCLHVLELDRHAEVLELGDHLLAAAAPRRHGLSRRNPCSGALSCGKNRASTCSSPQGARTLNSHPGITRIPSFAPSCAASPTPSVVS